MGKGSKLPSDGLGIYIGDGLPRALPGGPNANHLRSNELLEVVEQLMIWIDLAESQRRMHESLERLRTGDTSDLDPELLQLVSEAIEAMEQRKSDATT